MDKASDSGCARVGVIRRFWVRLPVGVHLFFANLSSASQARRAYHVPRRCLSPCTQRRGRRKVCTPAP
eukprot:scaffold99776_cov46-Tisochrysis_lutea.AAC.2